MRALITGIIALALGVTAGAQDSTVKSQTKVSGEDARAVTMRGCLQQTAGGSFRILHPTPSDSIPIGTRFGNWRLSDVRT